MKNKICKLLIASMLLSTTLNGAYAKNFTDLSTSHWAYTQIKALSDQYVVVGYPDGSFKPDQAATRAEFATMVIKALHQEHSPLAKTFEFNDVPYSHWAYNTIQRAVAFDLIKGFPDGSFKPADNVSKAEAIAIIVSALNTGNISITKAKEALSVYSDLKDIPDWALVPAGKSEIIGMTAHIPGQNTFNANTKITRAEIAADLYNMQIQAKLNPNEKLAEAMRPKKGEGIPIDGVIIDGTTATIPAGTVIPVVLMNSLNSQKDEQGEVFITKTGSNIVTKKDKYLLIAQDSKISGEITSIKPARYFIRNGKMVLDTNYINTPRSQKAEFIGNIDTTVHRCFWAKVINYIVKGSKVKLQEGKVVNVKLNKPVKVDLTNGWILE